MITSNLIADSEWERARLGKITASKISVLFTEPKLKADKEAGKLAQTVISYANEKVSEMLTGTIRQFSTIATEWGNLYEPDAIEELRKTYPGIQYFGNENKKFFEYGQFSGGSPDGFDAQRTTVFEIKCPESPANHIANLLMNNEDDLYNKHYEYWCQIQFNMLCVARSKDNPIDMKWMNGVFASYCPIMIAENLKLKTIPVLPNADFAKEVSYKIEQVENYMSEILKKLFI